MCDLFDALVQMDGKDVGLLFGQISNDVLQDLFVDPKCNQN
jgi:hypothetical protein